MRTNPSWAIVLAAGDGTRLRQLTTDARGNSIPKQYCSFRGGPSLLADAIVRARSVAPEGQVVTIVAADHRRFWERELEQMPLRDVVVQPRNRGTGVGLLLSLLAVLDRDPKARVCVLPSDHHVEDEAILAGALRLGLGSLDESPHAPVLLGITPDTPEPDYGWIVSEPGDSQVRRVRTFVEKPAPSLARDLHAGGALWNSFLIAAHGQALVDLYAQRLPRLLAAFRAVFDLPRIERGPALERLYSETESADFSRDVLQGSEERLRVVAVPRCGWTDLGTPERVAACHRSSRPWAVREQESSRAHARAGASMSLADVLEQREQAQWRQLC